jgi:hypothetical protein
VPVENPRELLILRDLVIVASDNRIRERNAKGDIERDEADGYSVAPADSGVTVTLDRAPRIGTILGFCALGRRLEDSLCFALYPLTRNVQKSLEERGKPYRKKNKEREAKGADTTLTEAVEPSLEAFIELVQNWTGVREDGKDVDCSVETKKLFLDGNTLLDSLAFCNIVVERSIALQRERLRTREADGKN